MGFGAGSDNSPLQPSISDSNEPGISVRYYRPAQALMPAITGYHAYSRLGMRPRDHIDWFLPGTANVRILVEADPVEVRIRRRNHVLPPASLFGPTTTALRGTTRNGWMFGFGISAIGWARLALPHASNFRNRIVPLGELIGRGIDQRLVSGLTDGDRDADVKSTLDAILTSIMGPPRPDEELIHRVNELILDNDHVSVGRGAEELGISDASLNRISSRYFGMTAKMLLTRARFLRSFLAYAAVEDSGDYSKIDPSYFDVPHFLRDARTFLETTPRRFRMLHTPFLTGSLRERAAVIGSPTQALDRI